jgi:receptor protein-tyrosine kinase
MAAKKVLAEMRAQFDYVIVDSSPLLAVTDAAILASNSDGVLIMARFGQSKREQLAHAVGNLEDVGAPLLGAVITMTPARGNGSYSYNYSYSYYGDDKTERPSLNPPLPSTKVARAGSRRRADRQRPVSPEATE